MEQSKIVRLTPKSIPFDEQEMDSRPLALHIRLDAPTYSSDGIEQGIRDAGFQYDFLNWQLIKFKEGVEGLRDRMIVKAKTCNPDLIFIHIQNPDVLDIETCQSLSEIAYTVLYTFDCRDKERMQWLYELVPHLSAVFFSNNEDVINCKELGYDNCYVLESSCDMTMYRPLPKEHLYVFDYPKVVFLGQRYVNTNLNFPLAEERQQMIEYLYEKFGDDFGAYGRGQKNQFLNFQQENICYNVAKIAINQNNYDKELYSSDRLWRIMACGCFCLTKYFKGIETMFERGIHLDWWHTFEELEEKIKYYLDNEDERAAIAKQGSLFVRENHTWKDRIEVIKNIMEHAPEHS